MNWYKASTGNHQGLIIEEKTGRNVAVSYDKEDADLIAAAPEMLEALRTCAEWSDSRDGSQEADDEALSTIKRIARAIIAKVENQ